MAVLNFPNSPSTNDQYIENNIIYTWTGNFWRSNSAQDFDARYLNISGDNMTGNLTLGTDKIVLNASSGAGTFASELKVEGSSTPSGLYSGISRFGSLLIGTSSEAVGNARLAIDSGNGNITSVGSATFDGNVGIGITSPQTKLHSSGTTNGAQATFGISSSGLKISTFQKTDNDAGVILDAQQSSNGTLTFSTTGTERMRIDSSGDITAGPFNISSSTGYGAQVDMAANAATVKAQCQQTASAFTLLYAGYMGTNRNFHVTAGGAASFTGDVTSKATFLNELQSGYSPTGSAYKVFSGSSTFVDILNNGAASFAGGLFSLAANGGLQMGSAGSDNGVALSMIAGTNPAPSAYTLIQGLQSNGSTQAFSFKADGSVSIARGNFQMNTAGVIQTNLYSAGTVNIDSSGTFSSPKIVLNAANGNASFAGAVSKGSGSFRIDHPLKPETHQLVHSFVEGPQADNIYRGKVELVDGTATVNIDTVAGMTEGTFAALNREIQCFTTNETGWAAIKGSVTDNLLTIVAQDNTCTDTISWLVIGERKDQHMYDTEWTDENGKVIVEPEKVVEETEPEVEETEPEVAEAS